ncbi:MAG TPA: hypothetical protein VHG91_12080 [Longimicrobium sp.]|nr:hypothetical protein [Longimicrobium sp.]
MAAWEFDGWLLPAAEIARCGYAPSGTLPDEAFETIDWWSTAQPPADYARRFGEILPPAASWSPNVERWGPEDGTRIDVVRADGRVGEIYFRLDARAPDPDFVHGLTAFAAEAGTVVRTEDGTLLEPDPEALLAALARSPAAAFAADPRAFLARLERRMEERGGEPRSPRDG